LALPAELNSHPGPAHLLELADALELDPAQRTAIEELFDAMQARAIDLGAALIDAEAALDSGFENGGLSQDDLRQLIMTAETLRAELRFLHLSQHLRTVNILTGQQIAQYDVLRGYTDDNPCANVPEGHNESMWRAHNGCD
jgi:hypothetical protein